MQVVVDLLQLALVDVAQQLAHPALALAGVEGDAQIKRFLQLGRWLRQHGQHAADMEPADDHGKPGRAELAGDIDRARELVGLHAHQAHKAAAGRVDPRNGARNVDDRVAFVIGFDVDLDIRAQRLLFAADRQDAAHAGQAVGGNGRAVPLDHVTLVVVVRRLDQDDLEDPLAHDSLVPAAGWRPWAPSHTGFLRDSPPEVQAKMRRIGPSSGHCRHARARRGRREPNRLATGCDLDR
jgi:hypothetical protein